MAPLTSKNYDLLLSLRNSGTYSDLTIKCGDAEFKVHKCIVCPQSKFLEKACEEQKWKEGQTGVIELKAAEGDGPDFGEDDPRAVTLMVDYLYLDDYDPSTLSAVNPIPLAENGKGEEGAVEHAVEVTQTDRLHSDQWFSNLGSTAFGTAPTAFGAASTGFGAASTGFGAASTGFGAASSAPQPNEPVNTFGGFGLSGVQPKKKKKGKIPAAEPPPDSFLEMHAKVFAIASKYIIESLERAALEKFEGQARGDWQAADLIAAMDVVFNQTSDHHDTGIQLRNSLKNAIVEHAVTLVGRPDFQAAVESIDGLAYDLFFRQTNAHF